MSKFAKAFGRIGFTAALMILAGTVVAEAVDNGSGGGSGSSNCEQTAKDDFNQNANSCNNVLSDLPGQLAQCLSDAKDDYNRAKAACKSQAMIGHDFGMLGNDGLSVSGSNGKGGFAGLHQSFGSAPRLLSSN